MDKRKVAEVLTTIQPATLAGRIRRVLEDVQELRRHEYTYEQIVVILKDKYGVEVTPKGDTKRAARNLSATICQIMKSKRKTAVTPQMSLSEAEGASSAAGSNLAAGVVDAKAHGQKVLEDTRRKIEASKKSIFALANREE